MVVPQSDTAPAVSRTTDGRGRAWLVVGLLAAFVLINYMDKLVVGLVGVEIMRDLQIDAGAFGIIQSSVFWLYAVGAIVGGMLVGRVPARWLLSATALIWALSLVPMIWTESYAVLLASRVLLGFAEGPAATMAIATVHTWFEPAKRALPSSTVIAGAGLGPVVAAPLITAITLSFSWHAAFTLLAVIGLVWVIAWSILGREGPEKAGEQQSTLIPLPSRIPYRKLLATRTILGTYVVFFATYIGVAVKVSWLPVYLRQGLGYDASTAGLLLTVIYLCSAVFLVTAGAISRLMTKRGVSNRIARGAFAPALLAGGGAATIGYALLDRGLLQTVLLLLAAALASTGFGVAFAVVSDIVPPRQRGVMISSVVIVYSLGGLLGPILVGRAVEAAASPAQGYSYGFALVGALMFVGALIGLLLINPDRDARKLATDTTGVNPFDDTSSVQDSHQHDEADMAALPERTKANE